MGRKSNASKKEEPNRVVVSLIFFYSPPSFAFILDVFIVYMLTVSGFGLFSAFGYGVCSLVESWVFCLFDLFLQCKWSGVLVWWFRT